MKKSTICLSIAMLLSSAHVFAQNDNTAPIKKSSLAPNIIAFSPALLTENGWGIGLSYERALDKNGILAFYGNVYTAFSTQSNYSGPAATINPYYYVSPGIKLYPTGNNGKVKYAVGPSLVVASGQTGTSDYPFSSATQSEQTIGVMINNSVNFRPAPHIYAGLELGIGWSYIDAIGGIVTGQKAMALFSFKMGYRY